MEVSTLMAFLSVWPHSNNKQTSTVIVTALRAEGEERTEDILLISPASSHPDQHLTPDWSRNNLRACTGALTLRITLLLLHYCSTYPWH